MLDGACNLIAALSWWSRALYDQHIDEMKARERQDNLLGMSDANPRRNAERLAAYKRKREALK